MKNVSMILALLFFLEKASAQTGYYVEKDHRIARYEKNIIHFLIRAKQLDEVGKVFKLNDYEGQIFVKKEIEIYRGQPQGMLIIQFGTLADHANYYWGILRSKESFLFLNTDDLEFKRFANSHEKKIAELLEFYIKQGGVSK